ncbi:hypothetical protein A8H39_00060 [Paraburkholderia fungorum]|uniref:hypothetical protein n=1 Tax=Paraburkholderia fungorum TaxID=134537 RepID=UPI000484E3EA|nr:hypothetical protein [Paraburkholderia fungorum]PNE59579.1 hypothetical protein A8H39_00060 [Paraburkholderia fungorum]
MTSKNEEQYIKIAADSVAALRRVDVFRVLDSVRADNIDGVTRSDIASFIVKHRADLCDEVGTVMREEFAGDGWTVDAAPARNRQGQRVVLVVDYVNPEMDAEDVSNLATWAEVCLGRSFKVDVTAYASVESALCGLKEQEDSSGAVSRSAPDSLTLAYVAIGARDALRQGSLADLDAFNGEIGFIEAVTEHVVFVDTVGDWFDANGDHPGVFAYEVATPFGEAIARAMIVAGNAVAEPGPILREVLVKAGYAEDGVNLAIQNAMHRK